MNIHESPAKEIFRAHGVPVPPGEIATTPEEAEAIATRYGKPVMVKAQVHAGGRGKAGGVKYCPTPKDAREKASAILGLEIKGLTVEQVLVTEAADIASEAYVGIIVDRATRKPVFMVSAAGGIDIEEVAASTPEKILYVPVDTRYGLRAYQASRMGFFLYEDAKQARAAGKIMQQLYAAFMASGASLAEINPLVVTPTGELTAVDGKMVIDDNELDRHLPVHRGQLAGGRDDERIDLGERGTGRHERIVQLLHDLRCGTRLRRVGIEEEPQLHRLERHQPVARVDRHAHDLLGGLGRDLLDIDAAGRTHHEHRLARRPVHDDAHVRLAGDVGGLGDEHLLHREPLDVHAQDGAGLLPRVLGRGAVLDAARLAAAAGMHLRLHHDGLPVAGCDRLRLVRRGGDLARRHGDAVRAEDLLRLVFVDIHAVSAVMVVPASPRTASRPRLSSVMIARPPERRTNSVAARTLGAMLPSPNTPPASSPSASVTVSVGSARCPGVPQPV